MSAEAQIIAPAGSFCPNEGCPDFGKVDAGNLINFGHTKKGTQRRQCKTCSGTFTITRDTIFYRRRRPQKDIVEALSQLAERGSIAAVARVKRVKEDTVSAWMRAAGKHWEGLEEVLLKDYHLSRAQIDALWTFVFHKGKKRGHTEEKERGTFWRGTLIDSDTRLRVGRAIGKNEDEVAAQIYKQLKERGHPDAPPPLASDGQGAYREQMVETWGQVPPYSGVGRPPTVKRAGPDWQYVQVIKHREEGRVVGVTIKVVYGDPETVLAEVGGHTAYVERTNLTSRQMNGRLVRKTLSFSKKVEMLKAASAWEDAVYNMTRTVKTLALEVNDGVRRWKHRTPAMVAGLTDHRWTVEEILTNVVVPQKTTNT